MGKATKKSGNLQRALEARRRANAEREARERAIVESLREFLDELDKLEHAEQSAAKDEEAALAKAAEQIARIERELNERLERVRRGAEEKATTIRRAAASDNGTSFRKSSEHTHNLTTSAPKRAM